MNECILSVVVQKEQQTRINDSLDNRVPAADISYVGTKSAYSSSDTLHSDTPPGDYSLTNLHAPVSLNSSTSGDSLSTSISDVAAVSHSSPLPPSSLRRLPPSPAAEAARDKDAANVGQSESSAAAASDDDVNKGLLRHKAFYRTARPVSVIKRSAVVLDGRVSLREARAHFMQSEVTRPTQICPPGTGDSLAPASRVALDKATPSPMDDQSPSGKASSRRDEEETVLKSWKLTRPMSASIRSPTIPLTPNVNSAHQRTSGTSALVTNSPTKDGAVSAPVVPARSSQVARQLWIADGSVHQLHSRPVTFDSHASDLRNANTGIGFGRDANIGKSDFGGRLLVDRVPTNGHMTDYQSKSSQLSATGRSTASSLSANRLLSPPTTPNNNHIS